MDRQGLSGLLAAALWCSGGVAGEADVIEAKIRPEQDGSFTISATLRHADSGWKHYADRWEVLGPQGQVLAKRVLWHPHVEEQPFTRSLGDITIPQGIERVTIRAHDSVHGHGGREAVLEVPR